MIPNSWLLPAAILLPLAATATHAAAQSPDDFLKHLYDGYAPGKTPLAFVYPQARSFVDASMLALLQHDEKMSKGEVGALDYDPICQCQDWQDLKVISVHTKMLAPDHATGDVTFTNTHDKPQTVHYDLVLVKGAWLIHDLGDKATPSLQAYLKTYKY